MALDDLVYQKVITTIDEVRSDDNKLSPFDFGKYMKENIPGLPKEMREHCYYVLLELAEDLTDGDRALKINVLDSLEEILPSMDEDAHDKTYRTITRLLHYEDDFWTKDFAQRVLRKCDLLMPGKETYKTGK